MDHKRQFYIIKNYAYNPSNNEASTYANCYIKIAQTQQEFLLAVCCKSLGYAKFQLRVA